MCRALKVLCVAEDDATLAELKRDPQELVRYLYSNNAFPNGCFLLTGTGIVPPVGFAITPLMVSCEVPAPTASNCSAARRPDPEAPTLSAVRTKYSTWEALRRSMS